VGQHPRRPDPRSPHPQKSFWNPLRPLFPSFSTGGPRQTARPTRDLWIHHCPKTIPPPLQGVGRLAFGPRADRFPQVLRTFLVYVLQAGATTLLGTIAQNPLFLAGNEACFDQSGQSAILLKISSAPPTEQPLPPLLTFFRGDQAVTFVRLMFPVLTSIK